MRRSAQLLALIAALLANVALGQPSVEPTTEQLRELRRTLTRYETVDVAVADGYERFGSCMSSAQGSQGVHFMHPDRIADPAVNILEPELLMYEPREDGTLRFIGVELLVFQEDWHAAGNEPVPVQLGREFGINMTLLDRPFYALHAWVWQYNPLGFFANWNPLVDCEYETVHGEEH